MKDRIKDLNITQLSMLYYRTRDNIVLGELHRQCELLALKVRLKDEFYRIPEDEARSICNEAVAQTIRRFLEYLEKDKERVAFNGLFGRILRRRFFDWFRHNRHLKYEKAIDSLENMGIIASDIPNTMPIPPRRDPLKTLVREEIVDKLNECMAKLSDKERLAWQNEYEDRKDENLTSMFSYKDALFHARQKLKDCMRGKFPEWKDILRQFA